MRQLGQVLFAGKHAENHPACATKITKNTFVKLLTVIVTGVTLTLVFDRPRGLLMSPVLAPLPSSRDDAASSLAPKDRPVAY